MEKKNAGVETLALQFLRARHTHTITVLNVNTGIPEVISIVLYGVRDICPMIYDGEFMTEKGNRSLASSNLKW